MEERTRSGSLVPDPDRTLEQARRACVPIPEEELNNPDLLQWIETAVSRLRFPPDRERVRKELTAHYEDRLMEYRARGLSFSDGRQMALEALGDPEETGRLLQAVHKPWLGWLLRIARILLVAVVIYAVFNYSSLFSTIKKQFLLPQVLSVYRDPAQILEQEPEQDNIRITEAAWRIGESSGEAQIGKFRVSVDCAGINYARYSVELEDGHILDSSVLETDVILRFRSMPWYSPEYAALKNELWLEDETGRVYHCGREYGDHNGLPLLPEGQEIGMLLNDGACKLERIGQDLSGTYYLLSMKRPYYGYSMADRLTVHLKTDLGDIRLPVRFGPWENFHENLPKPESEADAVAKLIPYLEVTTISLGSADPVSGNLWTASVPWSRVSSNRASANAEEKTSLSFVLALYGPNDRQPVSYEDLFRRLSLRDAEGTVYPRRECLKESSLVLYGDDVMSYKSAYYDGVVYFLVSVPDAKPVRTYELIYRADGDELLLRIKLEEEDGQ